MNCVVCLVKSKGKVKTSNIDICSKCLINTCPYTEYSRMKLITLLEYYDFEHGFCEHCLDTAGLIYQYVTNIKKMSYH